MARAPFQVGVFPFQQTVDGGWEYLIFQRSDMAYWQCIAGGGEDAETPLEAARREAFEEAGIPATSPYLCLQTTASAPISDFRDAYLWDRSLLVIPIHYFGVSVSAFEPVLSHEHTQFRWLTCATAQTLLQWDSDRTALWELDQRLLRHEQPSL